MKKRLTAIVLMLAFFTSTSLAAGYQKSITANFDVKLTVDGQAVSLTDAAGNAVQPFTYNGTTYVPIRAVADYLGAGVHYNSSTKTANLTIDAQDAAYFLYMVLSESSSIFNSCSLMQLNIGPDRSEIDIKEHTQAYDTHLENEKRIVGYMNALDANGNKYDLDNSLMDYMALCIAYEDLLTDYTNYVKAVTQKLPDTIIRDYWNEFFDQIHVVIDAYYSLNSQLNDDFYMVCT